MAILSSHTLNGTDGTHAGSIGIDLFRIADDGSRENILAGETDEGGRFAKELDLTDASPDASYELVFTTATYWQSRGMADENHLFLKEIVIRFAMPDPDKRYHIPVILAPNTYSVWLSR